jgi:hypothetical protein
MAIQARIRSTQMMAVSELVLGAWVIAEISLAGPLGQ